MSLLYDNEGDVLYLEAVAPYDEQETREIGEGVIARMNPTNGEVESLEILSFRRRFKNVDDMFVLPLAAHLSLLSA